MDHPAARDETGRCALCHEDHEDFVQPPAHIKALRERELNAAQVANLYQEGGNGD